MNSQLVKNNPAEGYQNVFPKTFIDAIKDKESGIPLQEILQGFNMYFLSYSGSRALTRCKVPTVLRKEGLWITYVLYDHTVVTEWYNSDQIDDNSWSMDSNWRVASNFLVGDVSVSADGYWVINGEKTEAKAQGEQGITPLLRVGANNKLQVSYNAGKAWKDISDYIIPRFRYTRGTTNDTAGIIQISMDLGKTWTNLSNEITNNLRISRYIGTNESLPTSGIAEGTIYMKGPYYDEGDTSHANPIYRMWVYAWKDNTLAWQDNGEFTSISTGVVQERGTSTTEVMSQDAVTKELTELESKNSQLGQEIKYYLGEISVISKLGTTPVNITPIPVGKQIDNIVNTEKLVFYDIDGRGYAVSANNLPYTTVAELVSVALESGTANNVEFHIVGQFLDVLKLAKNANLFNLIDSNNVLIERIEKDGVHSFLSGLKVANAKFVGHQTKDIYNITFGICDKRGNDLLHIGTDGRVNIALPTNQIEILKKEIYHKIDGIDFLESIKNEYRYIVPSFCNQTQYQLDLLGTNDLVNFNTIKLNVFRPTRGGFNGTPLMRDPSICVHNGYFYITYTTAPYSPQTNKGVIGMCRTRDFLNYEEMPPLNIEAEGITFNVAWAPAFCYDPISRNTYIVVSAVQYGGTDRHALIYKYDFDNHVLSELVITNINQIDSHFIYYNNAYYMFSNGPKLWKSDTNTLGSEWTEIIDIGKLGGKGCEAPFPIRLDNGKWRCFGNGSAADLTSRFDGSNNGKMYFFDSDSDDIEGGWGDAQEIGYPKHGLLQPTHFTIFDFVNKTY